MTVDLEAIARRQRCDLSALRVALPLLEQGYEPPFLARYRRDELGPVSERALWEVVAAVRTERQLEQRREELRAKYRDGNLDDDALLASIALAQTPRQLDRIARRIRNESGSTHPASRLAVRLLNPKQGDPTELGELAEMVVGAEHATAAIEGLDSVLAQFLAADSRMVQAASAWMDKHVQLHVLDVHDPHEGSTEPPEDTEDHAAEGDEPGSNRAPKSASHAGKSKSAAEFAGGLHSTPTNEGQTSSSENAPPSESAAPVDAAIATGEATPADGSQPTGGSEPPTAGETDDATPRGDAAGSAAPGPPDATIQPNPDAGQAPADNAADGADQASGEQAGGEQAGGEQVLTGEGATSDSTAQSNLKASKSKGKSKAGGKSKDAPRKKISPRQRRRKWLVGVLQPLKGKSLPKSRLTAFQVVMLGRALRSQVAQCAFKYNAGHLVEFLATTAAGLNAGASNELSQMVTDNEAKIREALEAAWWDDLIDRAARRLISVAADSLRRQMHRQPIEANNVLVIDAVGPRTSAVAVVGPGDRVLHTEDVPCQLTKAVRQQLVARLGELVHQYHVDLIVVSNGPARRGCMVALTELLAQSQGSSLRWTLAERAGAEVYAGGPEGNRELRSVPRRFRAAVWLCQLVRTPTRALAKVDVSKLRLGSYQRELADRSLSDALQDVVTSGVSQISVDANAADRGWLASLPGVTEGVAESIDRTRREKLFTARSELLALETWPDLVCQRQSAGFLRVYGGPQPLDATAIHPDDYALAEKLAGRLEIPLPPVAPPGYEPPNFHAEEPAVAEPLDDQTKPKFTEVKIAQVDPDAPFGKIEEGQQEDPSAASGAAEGTASEAAAPNADEQPSKSDSESSAATQVSAPTETSPATETETPSNEVSDADADSLAGQAGASTGEAATAGDSPASDAQAADVTVADTKGADTAGGDTTSASVPATPLPAAPDTYRHPLPDLATVSRYVKEWQVGEHRVRQIVRALCEPFRDAENEEVIPSVAMPMVPKLSDLKPGDLVTGVIVGVAGFGVFVELGPECSGLIHVSRVAEDYVEDLNEYLQIGDVITAWVIEIDSKRRRVSLSGISPERQAAVRQERQHGTERPPRGGGRTAAGGGGGGEAAAGRQGGRGGRTGAPPSGAATGRGGQGRDTRGGGRPGGGGKPQSGQGRGRQGGRRDAAGSSGPKTYTTVKRSDTPEKPLTDAMRTGDEPLRSFGDLMQFFKGAKEEPGKPAAKAAATPEGLADREATDQVQGEANRPDKPEAAAEPRPEDHPAPAESKAADAPADRETPSGEEAASGSDKTA